MGFSPLSWWGHSSETLLFMPTVCACLALHREGDGEAGGSYEGLEDHLHKKKLRGS